MVTVKTNRPVPQKNTTNYIGDNQRLSFTSNTKGENLTVIGNNCTVKVTKNDGLLKIIGNNNTISISGGNGNLECIGNNAKVTLAEKVPKKAVTFIGANGKISSMSEDDSERKTKQDSHEEKVENNSGCRKSGSKCKSAGCSNSKSSVKVDAGSNRIDIRSSEPFGCSLNFDPESGFIIVGDMLLKTKLGITSVRTKKLKNQRLL